MVKVFVSLCSFSTVMIDSQLSFAQHVNSIACKCYSELRRIKSFRRPLPTDAARTLVSKIDYCNCLLAGTPANLTDKLQSVMNAAARIQHVVSKNTTTSQVTCDLPTVATRSATGDVQIVSSHKWLCTRLFDGTLHSSCTIGTEPPAISCNRRSHHLANNIVRRPGLRTCWTTSME